MGQKVELPDSTARALIVGTGRKGVLLFEQLLKDQDSSLHPLGLIHHEEKTPFEISGIPVVGGPLKIRNLVDEMKVHHLIISVTPDEFPNYYRMMDECLKTEAKIWRLPLFRSLETGQLVHQIPEIKDEELLGREFVDLEMEETEKLVKGKVVLVTGAGGSIGSELSRHLVSYKPNTLILLGRGENNIFSIEMELKELNRNSEVKIVPVIANIQDKQKMHDIMERYRPDIVFHAAAHKHVPLMEADPYEAFKNNFVGTLNMALASLHFGVGTFVLISTDKAVKPTSVMGSSKRIAEMIVQHLNEKGRTKFISVRFGNVLGSRGSILPLFKRQIEKGGPVTITHPEMDRYFMSIPEAVKLVIQAACLGKGGEIFVLDMGKPIKIVELAKKMIKLSGYTIEEIGIEYTGIRPGEKLHEELLEETETEKERLHPKILVARPPLCPFDEIEHLLQHYQSYSEEELKKYMLMVANQAIPPKSNLMRIG